MRQHLRVLLPPLQELTPALPLAFALIGREGHLLRSGVLDLASLAPLAGAWPVHAILQGEDVVVTQVTLPPVPSRRLPEAVRASIEPMALSDLEHLRVAHGPRQADGLTWVAWTARAPLERAWSLLRTAGLNVQSMVPQALALPADDPSPGQGLALPAGPRWLAPLPDWSFVDAQLRADHGTGRWRRPLAWMAAACAVWVLGLNAYAARQGHQLDTLRATMRQTVAQAYPQIPVVIDPLRQARQQRDALLAGGGEQPADDFLPLAQAAAEVMAFAQAHVLGLQYQAGHLTLTLAPGYRPPIDQAALMRTAAEHGIRVSRDDTRPDVWHVTRPDPAGDAPRTSGGPA